MRFSPERRECQIMRRVSLGLSIRGDMFCSHNASASP